MFSVCQKELTSGKNMHKKQTRHTKLGGRRAQVKELLDCLELCGVLFFNLVSWNWNELFICFLKCKIALSNIYSYELTNVGNQCGVTSSNQKCKKTKNKLLKNKFFNELTT